MTQTPDMGAKHLQKRALQSVGPTLWNSQPFQLRAAPSVDIFCSGRPPSKTRLLLIYFDFYLVLILNDFVFLALTVK